MPNLRDIEKRISSVSSTKQITRTMEMVATAKIRRATDRMVASTPYSNSMVEMLAYVGSRLHDVENPLMQPHETVKSTLIIVVASDRGLAAGFNSNVFRHVEKLMKEKQAQGIKVDLVACGKKTISYFTYRKIIPVMEFRDLSADPTAQQAQKIATYAMVAYQEGTADEVIVVYNHTKNAAEQILREELILPVDTEVLSEGSDALAAFGGNRTESRHSNDASAVTAQTIIDSALDSAEVAREETTRAVGGDIAFEPDEKSVLDRLVPAYVRSTIYHALIDSAAAEQGARRTAMKAATDNANEMVETLSRVYNRVRQGAITTQITEIVSGAAAMED